MDFTKFTNPDFIAFLITSGLLLALIAVVWMIFGDGFSAIFNSRKYQSKRFSSKKKSQVALSPLDKHINRLLTAVNMNNAEGGNVISFYLVSGSLFLIFLFLSMKQSSLLFSVIIAVFFGFVPYIYLQVRLRTSRITASYEGESLVAELLNQYRIHHSNMTEAIENSIRFLGNAPHSQKLLFVLSTRIKDYKTPEELDELLADMVYAVDTEWIRMLANNIHLATEYGIDVVHGLDDILKELRTAKSSLEAFKRETSEGVVIAVAFAPILYVASIWFADRYMSFPYTKFLDYQFNTATGFKLFLVLIASVIINFVIISFTGRKKFDF